MSDTLMFYGVPAKPAKVFTNAELAKKLSRKATKKLLARGFTRFIPWLGAGVLAYEIYENQASILAYAYGWYGYVNTCTASAARNETCGWGGEFMTNFNTGCANTTPTCGGYVSQIGNGSPTALKPYFNIVDRRVGNNQVYIKARYEKRTNVGFAEVPIPILPNRVPLRMPVPLPMFVPEEPNRHPIPFWPTPDYWPDHPMPSADPLPKEETKPGFPAHSPFPFEVPTRVPMPSPMWDFTHTPGPATSPLKPGPGEGGGADPKPSPKPAPAPSPSPLPPGNTTPFVPLPAPPASGTKEKKFRSVYSPQSLLDVVSEGAEMVDCLYDQLPSIANRAAARRKFGEEMNAFWARYKRAKPTTNADKARLLKNKPKWNKDWADPNKADAKLRENSIGHNAKNRGIDGADYKLKYIYNHFHELSASVVDGAIKCAALNIAVDAVLGPLLGKANVRV